MLAFAADPYTLASIPAVIAACAGIIKLVLNYLDRAGERAYEAQEAQRKDFTLALETQQARQEKFLSNHMSHNTEAMASVAFQLQKLTDGMDRLHDDNIETARVLKGADADITRLVKEQGRGR